MRCLGSQDFLKTKAFFNILLCFINAQQACHIEVFADIIGGNNKQSKLLQGCLTRRQWRE
ncbi:hypothetical protein GPUN_1318 [Glaciecola punicea ACAM 611]|uniref:Uncharacterized protein n=1 Tax=Glaciecola punicea ACAM 611 TaxID=1121923 RepID=H5TAW5_9ALTE|nr:hypothetical protein GPUN_1318 [Glaciecola punicea ACAM 611]